MVFLLCAVGFLVFVAMAGSNSPAARIVITRYTIDEHRAADRWPWASSHDVVKPCPRCGRMPLIAMRYRDSYRESLYDAWLECNGNRGLLWPAHAKGLLNTFMADDGYGAAHSGRPNLRYLAAAWHEGTKQ